MPPDTLSLLISRALANPTGEPLIRYLEETGEVLSAPAIRGHIERAYQIYSTGGSVRALEKETRDGP